jgi:PAS domain S-box-containing protein
MLGSAQQPQQARRIQSTRTDQRIQGARTYSHDVEAILQVAQDAMALFDEHGQVVYANRLFHELVGSKDDPSLSTVNRAVQDMGFNVRNALGHPLSVNQLPVARALDGEVLDETAAVDMRMQALDGRELSLRVSATPLLDTTGRLIGCVAVWRDMTEAQRSADQLREFASRLAAKSRELTNRAQEREAIFESIADGLLVFDPHGHLLHLNGAARALLSAGGDPAGDELPHLEERLAEYTLHGANGLPLSRDEWPLVRVLRGEVVAGRETADAVRRLPGGGERVLNISAAPVYQGQWLAGATLTLRDVTDRRRQEYELVEHIRQLESIIETIPDGLAFYNAQGRTLRMNAAARRMLGYGTPHAQEAGTSEDWTEDRSVMDLHSQPLSREQWPVARMLRGETLSGGQAADIRVRRSNGEEAVLNVSGAALLGPGGDVIGAVSSMRDMTEARRLEDERTRMVSIVSHELNTPLAAISMAEWHIKKQAALGMPPSGEAIEVLADGVVRMGRLINDLVEAARMEMGHLALKLDRHDLRAVCRSMVKEQMRETEHVIGLHLPTRAVEINCDPMRIGQVLANLLSNALKYSPPDRPVTLRLRRGGGMARIEVRDEGPGIPAEALPYIFNPFYRVPSSKTQPGLDIGLGLGLYIARNLVLLHGGQIGVESVVGSGSTFWFTLPLLRSAASGG